MSGREHVFAKHLIVAFDVQELMCNAVLSQTLGKPFTN